MKTVEALKPFFTEDEILDLAIISKMDAIRRIQYKTGLDIKQAHTIVMNLVSELLN